MDSLVGKQSFPRKKMTKQLTGKSEDTLLHSAARVGNLNAVRELVSTKSEEELTDLLSCQNQTGETALYVAAEYGYVDLVSELVKHYNAINAAIKADNGYDALHIASRQGDVDVVKALLKKHPGLCMTVDLSNTTALHTAAIQGHTGVVKLLLETDSSLALIAKSNGKTALHSASRNGQEEVVKAILSKEPGMSVRSDNKGQNPLHMAAKGTSPNIVDELLKYDRALVNLEDVKGNTALHIASRKGRFQVVNKLLQDKNIDTKIMNKSGETALDTAENSGNFEISSILISHGVQSAKAFDPPNLARGLKQTVSDIKHEVHSQLKRTRQTHKRVQGIAKKIKKLHAEGLNNAINSNTVVAVLIATVAFAAIFSVPGQYVQSDNLAPGMTLGEANIARETSFMIFFIFDSIALFISLAVVVVQTSVVVIESKAKKQMAAIINKLMWLACVLISISFLALCFVVVGKHEKWLAISVALFGTVILAATFGIMSFWVISERIEGKKTRSMSRARLYRSRSCSALSCVSDGDEFKMMYAI